MPARAPSEKPPNHPTLLAFAFCLALSPAGGALAEDAPANDTQSGWNVLRHSLNPALKGAGTFPRVIETGGHRKSVAAVREGRADVATIDCVTYARLGIVAPQEIAGLKVLAETASAPSLP